MTPDNPLSIHTPKSLLRALIEGQSVVDHVGASFAIESAAARSVLQWYEAREARWHANVADDDVDGITRAAGIPPRPVASPAIFPAAKPVRRVHVRRVRAHRFAGLHSFHADIAQPDEFLLELEKELLSINGRNGVGKTSIINAIVWCLTGSIYRAHREPEPAGTVAVAASTGSGDADVPVVAPMPPGALLTSEHTKVDVHTWVEVEFVDESGASAGRMRRTLQRSSRGAIEENLEADIQLDPLTLEIGTRLPGLLPHIRIGKRSRLGAAVASLTGFRSLIELAGHAERVRKRILTKALPDAQRRQDELRKKAEAIRRSIAELVLASEISGVDGASLTSRSAIDEARLLLEAEHARLLADAVRLLGSSFDPKQAAHRKALSRSIEPAIAAIQLESFKKRPAAQRLANLRAVRGDVRRDAEAILNTLIEEARTLAELYSDPETASRIRLYARIAGWLEEEGASLGTSCPVCGASLQEATDERTGKSVLDHIRTCAGKADLWSRTVRSWDVTASPRLTSSLPESIRHELDSTLPEQPHDLLRQALVGEVFDDPVHRRTVRPATVDRVVMRFRAETAARSYSPKFASASGFPCEHENSRTYDPATTRHSVRPVARVT